MTRCAARSSLPPDRTFSDYGFQWHYLLTELCPEVASREGLRCLTPASEIYGG